MKDIEVSVIVPIYNVSKWISRCVETLMEQTITDNIEFLFIDDCSTDDSVALAKAVVSRFPERQNQCVFIHHDKNSGLPAARNTGLKHSKGKYIFHCDSDDYVEPEMLEAMLDRATRTDADYVWCDWYLSFSKNERTMRQPEAVTARKALSDILSGSMKYNVWNKLVRRAVYTDNDISFPEGRSMGEDMTMIRLLVKADKVASVRRPLYHYIRVNQNAMSQRYDNAKLEDLKYNVTETVDFLKENLVNDRGLDKEIDWFLLNTKLPFLFTGNKADVDLWREWYRESNRNIWSNRSQSVRSRILQLCARYDLRFMIILYINLVHRIMYGKIFR